MNSNGFLRQFHRWNGLVFVLAAIANIVALLMSIQAPWLGLVAVVPLIPLMVTGLYMFFRPYFAKRS